MSAERWYRFSKVVLLAVLLVACPELRIATAQQGGPIVPVVPVGDVPINVVEDGATYEPPEALYLVCGEAVSEFTYLEAMERQTALQEMYAASGFLIPLDVCTEQGFLWLDEEPLFFEGVYLPEVVNPNDPNDILPAESRDIPYIGQRIAGRRVLTEQQIEPFIVQVLAHHRTQVEESQLPPELQGINLKQGLLVVYISADGEMLDPEIFDPNSPLVAVLAGRCWSFDHEGGRATRFLPLFQPSSEVVEALRWSGEIQMGWVTGQRACQPGPCPDLEDDPVFQKCRDFAQRQYENCVNEAINNLKECTGLTSLSGGLTIGSCLASATGIGFVLCLASLGLSVGRALYCHWKFQSKLSDCQQKYEDALQNCCELAGGS